MEKEDENKIKEAELLEKKKKLLEDERDALQSDKDSEKISLLNTDISNIIDEISSCDFQRNLRDCENITNQSCMRISQTVHGCLTQLDVSGCTQLNSDACGWLGGIVGVGAAKCHKLLISLVGRRSPNRS